MATFYSPKGRRNSYKTPYVPNRAHKVQLKVSTFNWIVVLLALMSPPGGGAQEKEDREQL